MEYLGANLSKQVMGLHAENYKTLIEELKKIDPYSMPSHPW